MIGCVFLHLLFYVIVGATFLKDFELFHDDVTLLMHAGNLSNICLEIRRYEKNFIIGHDNEDFVKVLEYINEAQETLPKVIDDLKIMPQPAHLQDLTTKLNAYKQNFQKQRSSGMEISEKSLRERVRHLGQDLVNITEDLVSFEQRKMTDFIVKFKGRVAKAVSFLFFSQRSPSPFSTQSSLSL